MTLPGQTRKVSVALPADPNDCWIFTGAMRDGRTAKSIGGRVISAQRWMWLQIAGPIPPELQVGNTCGNARCVNPYHLVARSKGVAMRDSNAATLTPGDVAEIRKLKPQRSKALATVLGERFGVAPSTIEAVWTGRTWNRAPRAVLLSELALAATLEVSAA